MFFKKRKEDKRINDVMAALRYACDKDMLDSVVSVKMNGNIVDVETHKPGLWIGKEGVMIRQIHSTVRQMLSFDMAFNIVKSDMWQ